MKTIYIDTSFHCFTKNADGRTAIESDVFDKMSDREIECYIYKPLEDDKVFIQCFDSTRADAFHMQFIDDNEILNIITGGDNR